MWVQSAPFILEEGMTHRISRLFAVPLALASLALFAGCSSNVTTTTLEELQKSRQIDDNAAYSAMVENNYAQAQVATNAQGALTDPDATKLAQDIVAQSNTNLVTLFGSADVNPSGAAASEGGLGGKDGLSLVSDTLTDHINADASSDLAAVLSADPSTGPTPDQTFAETEVTRYTALHEFANSLLTGDPDGGVTYANEDLRAEIQNELTGWDSTLTEATTVCQKLDTAGTSTVCPLPQPAQ